MKLKPSLLALLLLFIIIVILRIQHLSNNELSWDVFGYYLYLPATFIHHDPFLNNIDWVFKIMQEHPVSGTLYQLNRGGPNGNMYFFLIGMAVLYLPFFLLGHFIALAGGYPADGFSLPYQYCIALGFTLYTLIGLYYFRKILLHFFNDTITIILLIIIVLGTNYLFYATEKNLETSNSLFVLLSLITWNTIRWHQEKKLKNLVALFFCMALTVLIKPSEIVIFLIPLLWGIYDKNSMMNKIHEIKNHLGQFAIASCCGILVVSPQVIYWLMKTGKPIVDTYYNPGVGLDFDNPHIVNVLISFRKGWLIYTPVMLLALVGFVRLYKMKKEIFTSVFVYFITTFYIISSWTEWWYGGGFSNRPLVTSYPLLSIPMGMLVQRILQQGSIKKVILSVFCLGCILLNLFQLWQFNNSILDPYRTTKEYYFAVFGKTKVDPKIKELMLIDRSFTGEQSFVNPHKYKKRNFACETFDSLRHSDKNSCFKLDSVAVFSPAVETNYACITSKDHAWIRAKVDLFFPEGYNDDLPVLVLTFERKEGPYGYKAVSPEKDKIKYNDWNTITMDYLTPVIRNEKDLFKAYVWLRGKNPLYIDNFKLEVFEPL